MPMSTLPINELISGAIAVILAVAVAVLTALGKPIPEVLSGAFLLVIGFYFRAQGFNAGVDRARREFGPKGDSNA